MSMTREEAIATLQEKYDYCKSFYDLAARPEEDYAEMAKYLQALDLALSAIRPVSREQVEKAFPGCDWCVPLGVSYPHFCAKCGRPLTDEAVQMVLERLEAIR